MSISAEDFAFFQGYLRERSAIVLEPGKEYLVETRLDPVARKEGLPGVPALLQRLKLNPWGPLQNAVVEALTTNETSFFRDWKPFEALRQTILPALIEARAAERKLEIWCGATSSGQEVYSLAMVLAEHFPQLATWDVTIRASDISQEMLARTQAGRFSTIEVNRGLPAPLLVKYFKRDGTEWVIADQLRARIRTFHANLAGSWPPMPPLDLILMRNVLIYFDVPTKRSILDRCKKFLRPNGAIFLGTAETTLGISDGWVRQEAAGATWFKLGPAQQ